MKFKNMLFGMVCALACNAYAGVTEGKIGYIFIGTANDNISFAMTSSNPNFNACAKQTLYSFTTSTQQGKNIYSAILAAKASGQSIQVVGANTCNLNPNSGEDIIYIAVLNQ